MFIVYTLSEIENKRNMYIFSPYNMRKLLISFTIRPVHNDRV